MQSNRQTQIIYASIGLFALYFFLQGASTTTRTTVALIVVPCLLLLTGYLTGYRKLRDSKLRFPYLVSPFLLTAMVVCLLLPDFRRVGLRWQLESLGARVTIEFDESYGYLPGWLKEELDWAALGRIKQVDFGHKKVPVAQLRTLSFDEPIWFLNFEGSDISRSDLNQIPDILDARIVHLSRTSADASTLQSFARMPSIKILYAIHSDVSGQDAMEFRKRNPRIDLDVGPATTSMQPSEATEPRNSPESSR